MANDKVINSMGGAIHFNLENQENSVISISLNSSFSLNKASVAGACYFSSTSYDIVIRFEKV